MIKHEERPGRRPRQIKQARQRDASLPPPKDYPEREPPPWKPMG